MTSNPRFWLFGGILASLLIAVLAWSVVISPRMEAVAQTREETEEIQTQTERTMFEVRELQQQAEDLPAQVRALEKIQRRIPSSVNVPGLLRQIQRSARKNDVTIDNLTPGQITVFATVEEAPAGDSANTTSEEPAPAPDTTAAAPDQATTDLGQTTLPKGVGLSYVPISIGITGEFGSVQGFTDAIENLHRAYLITQVDLARTTATDGELDNALTVTYETRVFVTSDRLRDLPDEALESSGVK